MRHILSILLIFLSTHLFAQNQCSLSHIVFNAPTGRNPQPIRSLGNNPQIKCLQNITNKLAFYNAIQNCKGKFEYKTDFEELNDIFKDIGFSDGINDPNFTVNSLNYETIPYNSKGMLGYKKNKKIGYQYVVLVPENHTGVEGWKVTSTTGCYVYIFTKCGNAFFPQNECPKCPPCDTCHNVSIEVPSDTTLCTSTSCDTLTIETKIYVHYKTGNNKGHTTYSEEFFWKSEFKKIIVPSAQNNMIITPMLRFEQQVCKDTIIKTPNIARVTMKSSAVSNCISEKNTVQKITLEVIKKQYKRIQKENQQFK